jgi:hypothetical protein
MKTFAKNRNWPVGTHKQTIIGKYFEKLGHEKVVSLKPSSPEFKYIMDYVKTTKDSMSWYISHVRKGHLNLDLTKPNIAS